MKKIMVYITVFTAGMLTMILEFSGTRIIAPYFGSSLYTWTSMIGVILGSLSIGYWIGGKLADKKPTFSILSYALLINALSCFLLSVFADKLLTFLLDTGIRTDIGALISTVLLFSIPSILFGVVSPYSVKLQLNSLKSSGRTVGNLYAVATIGSIVGTFLSGYYLLSTFESTHLILGISVILLVNALILAPRQFLALKLSGIGIIFLLGTLIQPTHYRFSTHQFSEIVPSSYNDYYILEDAQEDRTMRFLLTDFRSTQSGYTVGDNSQLFGSFAKFFTLPACFGVNDHILMIGGGGYSYPKYFLETFPKHKIDVVEIDPKLTQIAEDHFELDRKNPNLKIINEDGRVFLNQNSKKYSSVIIDAFDTDIIPFQLNTQEAFQKMHNAIATNGLLIVNIHSSFDIDQITLLDAEFKTLRTVFSKVEIYQVNPSHEYSEKQGFIIVGYKGYPKVETNCLVSDEGLFENKIEHQEKAGVPIFTDSFAPVEYYLMKGN